MASKSSQSLPLSSQKTKQQSISSFFAPKPSQASKPTPVTNQAPPKQNGSSHAPNEPSSDDDEDALPVRQISGFRRKRPEQEVSEDEDVEEAAPEPKRVRSIGSPAVAELADTNCQFIGQESITNPYISKSKPSSDRTSKYIFSSSPQVRDENLDKDGDAATQKQKERLHEKFVKKLGRPDSFAELRRRNKIISEDNAEGEEGEEEDEDETPKPAKGKKGAAVKKSGSKLTPMEKQYLEIKHKHMDTIIVMEVGYKFKFFGEDARTASKALGIVCIPGKFRYDERK
jgi:DNA mismatch repair protein MSH3